MISQYIRKVIWNAVYLYQTLSFSHGLNIKHWIHSTKDFHEFDRLLAQVYTGEINSLDEVILQIASKNFGSDCSLEKLDFLAKTIWKVGIKSRKSHASQLANSYIYTDLDFNSLYPSTQARMTIKTIQQIYPKLTHESGISVQELMTPVSIKTFLANN